MSIDVTEIYCMSKYSGPEVKLPLVARDILVNGLKLRTDAAVKSQTVALWHFCYPLNMRSHISNSWHTPVKPRVSWWPSVKSPLTQDDRSHVSTYDWRNHMKRSIAHILEQTGVKMIYFPKQQYINMSFNLIQAFRWWFLLPAASHRAGNKTEYKSHFSTERMLACISPPVPVSNR